MAKRHGASSRTLRGSAQRALAHSDSLSGPAPGVCATGALGGPAASAPLAGRLAPLGALAAGFGWASLAVAQAVTPAAAPAASAAAPAEVTVAPGAAATGAEAALRKITVKGGGDAESGKRSLQAVTTTIGKGRQDLRDVPQSVTVVTEKLIDERNVETLKDALKNTAGISFQAAEGGEEDIRLRGFSLQATGDIFLDGMRDPAFYDRDSFNWDRLELLRGSASMLFGRGSTGGAVNQVSKQPRLGDQHEVSVAMATGHSLRATADLNLQTGADAALRVNLMGQRADNNGAGSSINKNGVAVAYRQGIGTPDEVTLSLYHLENRNGINYGMPWLTPVAGSTDRTLLPVDPKSYYGAASDYSAGGVNLVGLSHVHKFADGGELKSSVRVADYDRDLRASAIRFCTRSVNATTGVVTNPTCPTAVTAQTVSDATVLTRGTNLKIQGMKTVVAQSDYTNKFTALGLRHDVTTGMDAAYEDFTNYGASLPTGVTLTKANTTVGTPNDGAAVDESLRLLSVNRTFLNKALGVYAQDLVQVAPDWKVLAGLRWDKVSGHYTSPLLTAANGTVTAATDRARTDGLWSKRAGVLFQPTPWASYYASYGTSFNTSGDTYQYDALGTNTPPEGSRNIEIGAKLDSMDGDASARVALFHTTKYNERNRDETSVSPTTYLLSGQRHAAGLEIDLAGRLTPAWEVYGSYAWIPSARVDVGASSGGPALTGESVGSRPGLTPRHTGTLWSTYKVNAAWRVGGGLNARSSVAPQGITTFVAPRYVTGDLMAEYTAGPITTQFNLNNVSNKLYADQLYRAHYIPGKGRTAVVTVAYKF